MLAHIKTLIIFVIPKKHNNNTMSYLIQPKNYKAKLNLKQTERGIQQIKRFFQLDLASELKLSKVTAPFFVMKGTGINDDLNGTERAVTFPIMDLGDQKAEVVHSLAKWKRVMLADLETKKHHGIYTNMNAIRADESLGNLHSIYVDQWDWELVISEKDRSIKFLKDTVKSIYSSLLRTEFYVTELFPDIKPCLPAKITFISAEELLQKYPNLNTKEREDAFTKEHKAVFIMGIGGALSNGEKHDGRAADYDDWSTPNTEGFKGLNGDILLWNPILERAFEISSMGIRVDKEALLRQLAIEKNEERLKLYFHKRLVEGTLPLSIGGGIGQSRLCMFLLRKGHIGEVQASIWPEDQRAECKKLGINLM